MNSNDREAQQRFEEDAQARAARDQDAAERRRADDDKRQAELVADDKERARLYDKRKAESIEGKHQTGPIHDEPPLAWMAENAREVEANRHVESYDVLDNQRAFEAALEKSGVHSRTRTDEIAMAEQRRILNHGAQAEREGYAEPSRAREDGPDERGHGDGPGTRPTGPEGTDGPLEPVAARKVRDLPDYEGLENSARMARERDERDGPHIRT